MQQHYDHCNTFCCFAVSAGIVPKLQLPLCPTPQHPGERKSQISGKRVREAQKVEVTWLVSYSRLQGQG